VADRHGLSRLSSESAERIVRQGHIDVGYGLIQQLAIPGHQNSEFAIWRLLGDGRCAFTSFYMFFAERPQLFLYLYVARHDGRHFA
jgi:hypothetical protein